MGDHGSVLLTGVGGQGVVLASAIVADAALRAGYDVKQSEVHGMSQRGGIVSSHLRFGPQVFSPLIEVGRADVVVALEWNEGLRALPYLRPGAPLILNLQRVVPPGACQDRLGGHWGYPPLTVDLRVIHTEPFLRGATVSASNKPATLETGLQVSVPQFIQEGDVIRIDTRENKYLERVKG